MRKVHARDAEIVDQRHDVIVPFGKVIFCQILAKNHGFLIQQTRYVGVDVLVVVQIAGVFRLDD